MVIFWNFQYMKAVLIKGSTHTNVFKIKFGLIMKILNLNRCWYCYDCGKHICHTRELNSDCFLDYHKEASFTY